MLIRNNLMCLLCIVALAPSIAEARIYQYTDDRGRQVYVDRLSKVPVKYRDQLNSREESKDEMSDHTLRQLSVERDIKQLHLKIKRRRSELQDAMKRWVTSFSFQANRILVPVKVVYGGRSEQLSLVMDTGASHTVVHKSSIRSLGAQLMDAGAARIADGSVVKTQRINFDRVEVGPYQVKHVAASVIDYKGGSGGTHGLLGMDFLYNAKYELDRDKQQIIWAPEKYHKLKEELIELDKLEQRLQDEAATPGGTEVISDQK
jgi:predicted aspartyl protease